MTPVGHVLPIATDDCALLLGERVVGRVAWASSGGIVVLPVNYVYADGRILIRVAEGSLPAELAEAGEVAFEVDDIDEETGTGWSVLVRGHARRHAGAADTLPRPWAPGERTLLLEIEPTALSGRSVSAAGEPRS